MDDLPLPSAPAPAAEPVLPQPIAPWWHTVAVLVLLAIWGGISGTRTNSYAHTPHPITYLSQMAMSWMLFGTVIAGVIHRRAFFFSTLRNRARSFFADAASGLAIYLGVYFSAAAIAAIIVVASASHHASTSISPVYPGPPPPTQSSEQSPSQSTAPLPPAPPVAPTPVNSHNLFKTKTILALAPRTPFDLLLWIGLSCTAGFCEEHVFRGYLLRQAIAFSRRAGIPFLLANIISILATSLIFGSLHLYEGTGGALVIAALGAIYSVIALKLGNLRAVIAAHFLQDFFAGLFLFFFHARLAH